jgi:hypothetical protein
MCYNNSIYNLVEVAMKAYRQFTILFCLSIILGFGLLPIQAQPPPNFDIDAAATQLGVTVEALKAALGTSPPNFKTAAEQLGISEDALRAVLDAPPPPDGNSPANEQYLSETIVTSENFVIQTGLNAADAYGETVSSAGDINGDGFDDFMIGARGDSRAGSTSNGNVHVYLGSADGILSSPVFTVTGEDHATEFGRSVGYAGDINGDGLGDVLVGAHAYNNHQGKVYLYIGSADGLITEPAWVMLGENTGDEYGRSIYTAGDVNADGFDDVLVGASGYTDTIALQGKFYLYLGSSTGLDSTSIVTYTGTSENSELGRSVFSAGDINNDGFDDVIIGAPGLTKGGETSTSIGEAFVFLGNIDGLDIASPTVISGESIGDKYGESASTAGDVNGDGFSDVIVGARDSNKAYVYTGNSTGLDITPTIIIGGDRTDFGRAVSSAGDINNDGYDDVMVGAPGQATGAFYIYTGSPTGINSEPLFVGIGDELVGGLGFYVALVGDINGDDYSDVLGGAPIGGDNLQGQAYIYFGKSQ